MGSGPNLLTERDLAQRLGVSLHASRKWRHERRGPQYIRVEGAIRYRSEDVDDYLSSRTVATSTDVARPEATA